MENTRYYFNANQNLKLKNMEAKYSILTDSADYDCKAEMQSLSV